MPNDIPERQNEQRYLDLNAGFSQAYDNVATVGAWQTTIVVGTAILIPLINFFYPQFQAVGLWISVVVIVMEFAFEFIVKHYQTLGAKIQELYDTELFQIPWNKIKAGSEPITERIVALTNRFKALHANDQQRMVRLRDWYPPSAGELPISLGRLVCQRSSMVWDSNLRGTYCLCYLGLAVLMLIGAGTYIVSLNLSAEDAMKSVVAPLAAATIKIMRGFFKHRDSAATSEKAWQSLTNTWQQAMKGTLSDDELDRDARFLQNELLERRLNSARIPDWFYRYHRSNYETQMLAAAEEMVNEAKNKLAAGALSNLP